MSGGRPRGFRLGDRSELLVEHLLAGVAFTTRVPRHEDIGIDFMCSLITGSHEAGLLKAGPFFSVQAKSSGQELLYEKPHELEWIMHQENPLLICVADREASAMDVYSTWNLLCAVHGGWNGQKAASCIRLCPGVRWGEWPGVRNNPDGSQDVLLDKPIVRVTHDQVFDEKSTTQIAEVLAGWVSIDRVNIVNRHAGLNFVVSPRAYETGKPPSGPEAAAGYWHPQNLPKCMVNLGRSAAAVWNLLEPHQQQAGFPDPWKAGMPRLKELLSWLCEGDPNLRAFICNLNG
jgi:hypothetical protein